MPARLRLAALALCGLLAACVPTSGSGSPSEMATPSAASSASQAPSSEGPGPTASVVATTGETPEPDPAAIDLVATSCPGGAVLEWTPSRSANFHHYTALRSPEEEIATAYPPIAPAVDWGETYATDPFVTSAVDASILPSSRTWHYRVMAYDILNGVVGASPVRSARIDPPVDLGDLGVEAIESGATRLTWEAFSGPDECFTSYRVLSAAGGSAFGVLTVISDPGTMSIETGSLHAGTTYQLRVEAVRTTTLGEIIAGRSETVAYAVP